MIYFDNAATTYPKPEIVYETLNLSQRNIAFNAGRGSYEGALKAKEVLDNTRNFLIDKANGSNLIFAPAATHAINLILHGIEFIKGDIVYYSPYDHNAIVRTLHAISKLKKIHLKQMPLNDDLSVDIEKLKFECMLDKPKLMICTHVSNVTGYILPIEEIGTIATRYNSVFVVDGAQSFGLVDVDMKQMSIDYFVFAGHKTLYGPFGSAGFISKMENPPLQTSIYGGTGTDSLNLEMPETGSLKYEPSSLNVVAIAAMLEGAKWVFKQSVLQHERMLYQYAFDRLGTLDGIVIYNTKSIEQNTGIIAFNIEGFDSNDISKILDLDYKICVRGGYHCCPFIHDIIGSRKYNGTIRISFSAFNTIEEIDELINTLDELILEG